MPCTHSSTCTTLAPEPTYVVIPKGTACFAAPSLGEIARQISDREYPGPPAPGAPASPG